VVSRRAHWARIVYSKLGRNFSKLKQQLQLLQRPQVIPDVSDRFHRDAFVHRAHLLRAKLRDTHTDRELLPLGLERDRRPGGQRRVCGREPPAGGCQAGTHHVCAGEEETDRAAVDADMCEDEGICGGGCGVVASRVSDRCHVMDTHICGAGARWGGKVRQGPGKRAARCVVRRWRGDLCCFCSRRYIQDQKYGLLPRSATDHFTCTIDSFFGHISSSVSASIFHEESIVDRMPR
jgi:hypothetical protein